MTTIVPSSINLLYKLADAVDATNYKLIDHMTEPTMRYDNACVQPDLTYDYFYSELKQDWENDVNHFLAHEDKCQSTASKIISLTSISGSVVSNLSNYTKNITNLSDVFDSSKLKQSDIEDFLIDGLAGYLLDPMNVTSFSMRPKLTESIIQLFMLLRSHCYCQTFDIFNYIVSKAQDKYFVKYQQSIKNESDPVKRREFLKQNLKQDLEYLKNLIKTSQPNTDTEVQYNKLLDDLASKLTGLYNFSIDSELNRLIPEELGSLKKFFAKVISTYFNKLHPIIWAQILKQIINQFFTELPTTPEQAFQFISKSLLLNSGPFILKILQMIRPILTPELATKYNLTKLTYPQLTPKEYKLILRKIMTTPKMTNVIVSKSASVGHVCLVNQADQPQNVFVIKIIKPLSVAQSCWEYKTLSGIFNKNTCEYDFVRNMLESNGREMNIHHEIENINKGHKNYHCTYSEVFGTKISATLSTVKVLEGYTKPDCWFAFAMSLAPGVPVADLVESDLLKSDTPYRAKLHRCFDLLVYKFFLTIANTGFYHGDLHAGNVFFSYEQNQMTMIDFGAVGDLSLWGGDSNINALLEIVVMSVFYNFDGLFDKMTVLLNNKCDPSEAIDMNSEPYKEFSGFLTKIKFNNMINSSKEGNKSTDYRDFIFSDERVNDEIRAESKYVSPSTNFTSGTIYSRLDFEPKGKEPIIHNEERDVLSVQQPASTLGESKNYSFAKVLEFIIKFYASMGVNIAIKFSDFYEFQKAYILLLGVLAKVGYSSYRIGFIMKKAILNWELLPKLMEISTIANIVKSYYREKTKHGETDEWIKKI